MEKKLNGGVALGVMRFKRLIFEIFEIFDKLNFRSNLQISETLEILIEQS